jgi:type III pantothenate kinase
MSALLLDLGNSRWKAALAVDGDLSDICSGEHGRFDALDACLARQGPTVRSIWLASVADAARTDALLARLRRLPVGEVRQVRATDPMPDLRSGYRKPGQLGIDRLLAMVAVRAISREPFCVIDAGSAVTIDFVDADGQHLGGFILPGERLARDCLLANTSIPRDAEVEPDAVLGRDTATAVALGGRYAVAGIVEHFLAGRAALFPGQLAATYVGGGDAGRLMPLLPAGCIKLDHLVLRGLAVLAAGKQA